MVMSPNTQRGACMEKMTRLSISSLRLNSRSSFLAGIERSSSPSLRLILRSWSSPWLSATYLSASCCRTFEVPVSVACPSASSNPLAFVFSDSITGASARAPFARLPGAGVIAVLRGECFDCLLRMLLGFFLPSVLLLLFPEEELSLREGAVACGCGCSSPFRFCSWLAASRRSLARWALSSSLLRRSISSAAVMGLPTVSAPSTDWSSHGPLAPFP
mmetsp:Transcript_21438/g.38759  ORF Transcript_21438/g.38759 Transcript_21438/m.38759 type:complete len:217 (-) Transcript_21438:289-939(-)